MRLLQMRLSYSGAEATELTELLADGSSLERESWMTKMQLAILGNFAQNLTIICSVFPSEYIEAR